MRCQLCGYVFDEAQLSCHASCAFNEGCGIICCPNCGYQVADVSKSRLAMALKKLMYRARTNGTDANQAPIRPLSAVQPGQSGKVVAIESSKVSQVERLHVLGLVPDAQIVLEQTRPTFVLRVGFTELSIEREIADLIVVEVER